jgi:hypothetical protein
MQTTNWYHRVAALGAALCLLTAGSKAAWAATIHSDLLLLIPFRPAVAGTEATPGVPPAVVADSAGAFHSTSNTGVPFGGGGARSTTIQYAGSDASSTNFGNVLNPGTGDYSVGLWFYADSVTGTRFLASKGNNSSGDQGWSMFVENGTLHLRVNYASGTASRIGVSTPVQANTWYHAAMVLDNTNGHLEGYLNGLGSGPTGNSNGWQQMVIGSPLPVNFTAGQNIAPTQALMFGRRGSTGAPFLGKLDDVRIYRGTALSAADVAALAADQHATTGLTAWYKFEDGGSPFVPGTVGSVTDAVGSNHGVVNGGNVVFTNTDGVLGDYGRFPRQDTQHIDFGTATGNPGIESFSVSFWFKADSVAIAAQFLASKGNAGSGDVGWSMWLANNSLHVRGQQVGGASGDRFGQVAAGAVTANEWHHVVMVVDRESNVIRGYLNGSNEGFVAGGGGAVVDTLVAGSSINNTLPLLLGRRSTTGAAFGGSIDDFAIWNRALTPAEVSQIHAAGLEGIDLAAIPEPSSLIVAVLGFVSLLGCRRSLRNRM